MDELIKRSDVMPAIETTLEMYPSEYDAIANKIDATPAIDPDSLRQVGHWIDFGDYVTTAYGSLSVKTCSECHGEIVLDEYDNYCPCCGSMMKV